MIYSQLSQDVDDTLPAQVYRTIVVHKYCRHQYHGAMVPDLSLGIEPGSIRHAVEHRCAAVVAIEAVCPWGAATALSTNARVKIANEVTRVC